MGISKVKSNIELFKSYKKHLKHGRTYRILDSKTLLIGGKKIIFPCSISGCIKGRPFIVEKDDLIIVNFYPWDEKEVEELEKIEEETGLDPNRNIWALSREGELVWTIERATPRSKYSQVYTSVYIEDDNVIGGNWSEFDYIIDTSNGDVKKLRQTW